ncbi:MAG: hypothetical protein KBT22_01620 [Bacteroidales bacterium]|nr:hypothetical protein [Candidatus Scybalocola fimicaballi]
MAKIFDIQDIPEEYLPLIGGKARGLHQLIKFGFQVPQAFIITDIEDDEDFEEAAKKYTESGMQEVSVRSSATLEDGVDFSAAGQFSTFLNVKGVDDLKVTARKCLDSLHNKTAEHYADMFLHSQESKMTIVVQKMVNAKYAGVIFSRAPMSPGFVLVEAVPGLGENLVSGKMSAQQYLVRIDGTEKVDNMPQNPLLSENQAIALGNGGKKAEKMFGMPMDLEYAIDENDNIQWLQARPITIDELVTDNELDCDLDATNFVYTTGNIGEVMPGAVTPLNLSTNMYALDWGVKQTYIELNACDKDIPPYSFLASYYNHMFFNMTNIYRINHTVFGTTKETSDESICGMVLEGLPGNDMKDAPLFKRISNTIKFGKIVFDKKTPKEGMDKVVKSLRFDLDKDMKDIYQQIIDKIHYLNEAQYYHYLASYYSGGQSAMLNKLEKDFDNKDEFKALVAGCMTQNEDFESANVLRMLRALAESIVNDNPDTKEMDTTQLAEYMQNNASEEVKKKHSEFMARHGFRGLHEPEIMSLPWRDNPESFYTSLRSVLIGIGKDQDRETKPWSSYANELCSHYSGFKRKMVMDNILKARKGVCYREYTKSRTIYVLDQFKQAYRKLSQLMVNAKILPDSECIYFLLQDEVGKLLNGDSSLVKKAIARRRIFPQQQNLKFPYAQLGVPQPILEQDADGNTSSIQGTPVSRGVASGRARVVYDEKDASLLQEGEIMVTTCTDIGWTPYYSIIAGLVTEIGSALSHGVVVAREYALPTVVNANNAMCLIKTGDMITIDGNTGRISINKKADK